MEIERKYLIKVLPENLTSYKNHKIEQGYLCTEPVVRIRRQDDEYYLTYKSKGLMVREEYNLPLTAQAYRHLKEKADGLLIMKGFSLQKWNFQAKMRPISSRLRPGLGKM